MADVIPCVHLIDDDDSVRKAIARVLRAAGYIACEYGSAGEFALQPTSRLRGCLVLDVRMPGPGGLELQDALNREGSTLPVIFLTGHGDIPMSVRAMKAGAIDFLTKPVQKDALLAAVRTALEREVGRHRVLELRKRIQSLSERERQVCDCVIEGRLNKQIAADLGMAVRTVKAHRARVMQKMGASSLAELVHLSDQMRLPQRAMHAAP